MSNSKQEEVAMKMINDVIAGLKAKKVKCIAIVVVNDGKDDPSEATTEVMLLVRDGLSGNLGMILQPLHDMAHGAHRLHQHMDQGEKVLGTRVLLAKDLN